LNKEKINIILNNLRINVFEREINRLVYELYGLTEEEIAIIAGE